MPGTKQVSTNGSYHYHNHYHNSAISKEQSSASWSNETDTACLWATSSANRLNERAKLQVFPYSASTTAETRKCKAEISDGLFFLPSLQEREGNDQTSSWPPSPAWAHSPQHPLCAVAIWAVCVFLHPSGRANVTSSSAAGKQTSYNLKSLEGQVEKQHLPSNSCQGRLWGWTQLPVEMKTWRAL